MGCSHQTPAAAQLNSPQRAKTERVRQRTSNAGLWDEAWQRAPIVVGGTGGSGTRGVVDTLKKLGIFMHPKRSSKAFEQCYNGAALDNVCMHPEGRFVGSPDDDSKMASPHYAGWLIGEHSNEAGSTCEPRSMLPEFPIGPARGLTYMSTVPPEHQLPHRWGWKNPKTVFHLEKLLASFPDLIFIHVLRNPLDMASSVYEHLPNRVKEYSYLHGGFPAASEATTSTCLAVAQQLQTERVSNASTTTGCEGAAFDHSGSTRGNGLEGETDNKYDGNISSSSNCERSSQQLCELTVAALESMGGKCKGTNGGKDQAVIGQCAKHVGQPRKSAWRCLEMQLWAEINGGVHAFGQRCLVSAPPAVSMAMVVGGAAPAEGRVHVVDTGFSLEHTRYVEWHAEDEYGLRGSAKLATLQGSIAGKLTSWPAIPAQVSQLKR